MTDFNWRKWLKACRAAEIEKLFEICIENLAIIAICH